jgi:hypothetical protein
VYGCDPIASNGACTVEGEDMSEVCALQADSSAIHAVREIGMDGGGVELTR